MSEPIIEIRGLRKTFGQGEAAVTARCTLALSQLTARLALLRSSLRMYASSIANRALCAPKMLSMSVISLCPLR